MKPPGDDRIAPKGTAARDGEDEDFLARWSRRKQLAREAEGQQADEHETGLRADSGEIAVSADGATARQADINAAASLPGIDSDDSDTAGAAEVLSADVEAEVDAPPELPSIDSLDENSDYSAFLTPGVAANLQRRALRKLFRSPKFNLRDGLDDYDLDFSNPEPLGDIVTADMRHRLLKELERLADSGDEPEPQGDEHAATATGGAAAPRDPAHAIDTAAAQASDSAADDLTGGDDPDDDDRPRPV